MTKIVKEALPEYLEGTNETGILIIHGFTKSPQSMRPIAHSLNKLGYTINMPCLKGHGTTPEDMETTGYKDWIESVEIAYKEIKPNVKNLFVLGLSLGGTLTMYSAINFSIKGAITINAATDLPEYEKLYNDPSSTRFIINSIDSDIKKPGVKEWTYDKTPKKCIKESLDLIKIVKKDIPKITCPFLIFKSLEDHIVPPSNQNYIYENIKSKERVLIELKESYHTATLDNDMDLIISKIDSFIKKNI